MRTGPGSSTPRRVRARGRRLRTALTGTAGLALLASLVASPAVQAQAQEAAPGERPVSAERMSAAAAAAAGPGGLELVVNERGRLSRSITAAASSTSAGGRLLPRKPAGATVRRAYLAYATTGFTGARVTTPLLLQEQPVPISAETANGIDSWNYFADVTSIVRPVLDAAPAGTVPLTLVEPDPDSVDGAILVVVYDDPAVTTELTVSLLFGALSPNGDSYDVRLAEPVRLSDPDTRLEMSLGISYSFQSGGAQQYSLVDVNGRRLSTSAGGEDDGEPENGSLITVGGDGDAPSNPVDAQGTPSGPRSDDEAYDLRAFVQDGDTAIRVETRNPSLDDNVLLAAFTMNPPVTSIGTGDAFVQVALGDSYQSGEGAGNSLAETTSYLTQAYEDGTNLPTAVGPQQDTYSQAFGGNGCHRSLVNYAKINRDLLEPTAPAVLVDVTCSGAQIQPAGRPPIVGTVGSRGIDPASQVQQALDRLRDAGLTAADVDLVTVGMGGNDAKFGDIVAACLVPNLVRRLLREYPDPPGEIDFIANQFATCSNADALVFKTGPAIEALAPKQSWAQAQLLDSFPRARILQLNYPDILPAKKDAPSWCGGMRKEDLDFAKQKVAQIDAIVDSAVSSVADSRYQLVDVKQALGANALCPATAEATLANGLDEDNFDTELRRLLDLDGNGDARARAMLDDVVEDYRAYTGCLITHFTPFGDDCDIDAARRRLIATGDELVAYLQTQQETIQSNIIAPPGQESRAVRVDRSQGLFHPNANGFAVLACHVRAGYGRTATAGCLGAASPLSDTVNGARLQNAPVEGGKGVRVRVRMGGWEFGSTVRLRLFSTPIDLGTVTAGPDGTVDTTVELPAAAPGVHTLVLQGESAGGTGMQKRVLLRYDGRPRGGDAWSTYVCCFTATDAPEGTTELVDVEFRGDVLDTLVPDEDGGVFVQLPVLDLFNDPGPLTVTVRSRTTGKTISTTIDAVPSVTGLWATSTQPGALVLSGSSHTVSGRVHSESDVTVSGTGNRLLDGVEHATGLFVNGRRHEVPSVRRVTGGLPVTREVAAYRPGGSAALAAGVAYTAVPASACTNGTWQVQATRVPAGVVHVPCDVVLVGPGTARATVVAEGTIVVRGSGVTVTGSGPGTPSLLSAARGPGAVQVSGRDVRLLGAVEALDGEVRVTGANVQVRCGVTASTVRLAGSGAHIDVDDACRAR